MTIDGYIYFSDRPCLRRGEIPHLVGKVERKEELVCCPLYPTTTHTDTHARARISTEICLSPTAFLLSHLPEGKCWAHPQEKKTPKEKMKRGQLSMKTVAWQPCERLYTSLRGDKAGR